MASYAKNRKNPISATIANRRQDYPYGILYGAFSPTVQNQFPDDYVENTCQLMERLAMINPEMSMVISIQRDKKQYTDITSIYNITEAAIPDTISNAYQVVKKHKDSIINGVERSNLINEIFPDLCLTALTRRYLVKAGIVSINQIDRMNSLDEFIQSIKEVANGNSHTVADDFFIGLMNSGYDTSRFGYIPEPIVAEEEIVEAKHRGRSLSYDEAKIPEVIEWVCSFEKEPIPEKDWNQFIDTFTRILKNASNEDNVKLLSEFTIREIIKKNSDYTFYKYRNFYFFVPKAPVKEQREIAETLLRSMYEEEAYNKNKAEREKAAAERYKYTAIPVKEEEPMNDLMEQEAKEDTPIKVVENTQKQEVEESSGLISEDEVLERLIRGKALPLINVHVAITGNCPKCGTLISFVSNGKESETTYCSKCLQKIKITY